MPAIWKNTIGRCAQRRMLDPIIGGGVGPTTTLKGRITIYTCIFKNLDCFQEEPEKVDKNMDSKPKVSTIIVFAAFFLFLAFYVVLLITI